MAARLVAPSPQNPPIPRSEDYQDLYATQIRIGVTLADMSLVFSVIEDFGPANFGLRDRATVRLAPLAAKLLQLHLNAALTAYEETCGEVAVPFATVTQIEQFKVHMSNHLQTQMGAAVPINESK